MNMNMNRNVKRRTVMLACVLVVLAVLSGGCLVTSLNPLYTDKDIVYEPSLVGTWRGDNDKETWMFAQDGEKGYSLTIIDDESSAKFEAKLLKLEGRLFLDIFPEEPEKGNFIYMLHTVPVHSFLKLSLEGDTLQLAFMELEWFEDRIKSGADIGIDYVTREEDSHMVLLTAKTDKLQAFVTKHADDDTLYKMDELQRVIARE